MLGLSKHIVKTENIGQFVHFVSLTVCLRLVNHWKPIFIFCQRYWNRIVLMMIRLSFPQPVNDPPSTIWWTLCTLSSPDWSHNNNVYYYNSISPQPWPVWHCSHNMRVARAMIVLSQNTFYHLWKTYGCLFTTKIFKRFKCFTELEQLEYSFIIENAKCEHLKLTSVWHWYAFSAVNKWC